jgi:hypothetical protein
MRMKPVLAKRGEKHDYLIQSRQDGERQHNFMVRDFTVKDIEFIVFA